VAGWGEPAFEGDLDAFNGISKAGELTMN